jgi:hypothetical protein
MVLAERLTALRLLNVALPHHNHSAHSCAARFPFAFFPWGTPPQFCIHTRFLGRHDRRTDSRSMIGCRWWANSRKLTIAEKSASFSSRLRTFSCFHLPVEELHEVTHDFDFATRCDCYPTDSGAHSISLSTQRSQACMLSLLRDRWHTRRCRACTAKAHRPREGKAEQPRPRK